MKTNEFIKYFEYRGYFVENLDSVIEVTKSPFGWIILSLNKLNSTFNCDYINFELLDYEKKVEYYKVIFEYLITPVKERED